MPGIARLAIAIALWSAIEASAAVGMGFAEPPAVVDKVAYGPSLHMSGIYFTNFENSKFFECAGTACAKWAELNGEWLSCAHGCRDLERRIKMLNGSHDRWGTYHIDFVGRRSLHSHRKAFIGDTTGDVLLEKVVDIRLVETR